MSVILGINSDIALSDMKDGQLAQTTAGFSDTHIGKIVQRFENRLICIGKYYGYTWPDIFTTPQLGNYRVRLLQPGEKIVVNNNEREGTC